MPSLVSGFSYDIFVSYRQKDNKYDQWVTDFVGNLSKELEATFKEDISIYFDQNPHDGLLETHLVDESLRGKLKCLIFIPIISQTYCDPKCFAWQHEFCAFHKQSATDEFGLEITLPNGNVSSRILPVKIHDIDSGDVAMIESEMGRPLRAIDFVFRSPGVNRPLTAFDKREENGNKALYRDQINKVANAVKETIGAMRNPGIRQPSSLKSDSSPARPARKWQILGTIIFLGILVGVYQLIKAPGSESPRKENSIAVLAFVDMSPAKDQEYLGDGIAEEILNQLTKIKGVKVIGRTSSFSFKGKNADLKTIGRSLGASSILEGSVQKAGTKIRITAQLINAEDETHIWSEHYDREESDLFSIQDEIAGNIIAKLQGSLLANETEEKRRAPTKNFEAYEMLLRARQFRTKGMEGQNQALTFCQQAIAMDPEFAKAYLEMATIYWYMGVFDANQQKDAFAKAKEAVKKALLLDDQMAEAYNMLGLLNFTVDWDWGGYLPNYQKAVELGLPLPDQWHGDFDQWILDKHVEAVKEAEILADKDPLSIEALVHLSRMYLHAKKFDDCIKNGAKAQALSPDQNSIMRHVGESYFFNGRYDEALKYFERLMQKNPLYIPYDYIAVQVKLGHKEVARKRFNELRGEMGLIKKAICHLYLDEKDSAFVALEKAYTQRDASMVTIKVESHFASIQNDPRFLKILERMKFPK